MEEDLTQGYLSGGCQEEADWIEELLNKTALN